MAERIRQQMMMNSKLYPEFAPRQKEDTVTIASTNSSSSTDSAANSRASAVYISSDEEDSQDNGRRDTDRKPSFKQPVARPDPLAQRQANVASLQRSNPLQKVMAMPEPMHFPAQPAHRLPAPGAWSNAPPMPIRTPAFPERPPGAYDAYANKRIFDDGDPNAEKVVLPDRMDGVDLMSSKEAEEALRDLVGGNMNAETAEIDMNEAEVEGFKDEFKLLPHQVLGRRWMAEREDASLKRHGGILADDMGLGKTIQTLCRIIEGKARSSDKEDGWAGSTLVVCPLALVNQWAEEIERICRRKLKVIQHHGPSRTANPVELSNMNVVITTYDVLKSEYAAYAPDAKDESKAKAKPKAKKPSSDSDSDEIDIPKKKKPARKGAVKNALFKVKWFRVVLDEAHNIKNHKTKGASAACELQAKFRWCLTGTPMQNDVLELYSLLKFLRIKPLSNFSIFKEQIADPVKKGQRAGLAMKRLQAVLTKVMLRRTKNDTLNGERLIKLPPRNLNIIKCPFSPSEQMFYDQLTSKIQENLEKLLGEEGRSVYTSVLLLLLRLRQACDHPMLVSKDYKEDLDAVDPKAAEGVDDKDPDADDLIGAFAQLGVTKKCHLCNGELSARNKHETKSDHCNTCGELQLQIQKSGRSDSAKVRMILKLLRETDVRSGSEEKTIIFSQFTSMLELIEPILEDAGIKFVRYDGSMSRDERDRSLKIIRTKPDVRCILISFKAGSTGLNLTACNNVILVDLWWNPFLEDQAFDRAHRFGQQRPVNIYKLMVEETVEERIMELQEKKRLLAAAALSGDKVKGLRLGMDDLLALFRPGGHDDDEEDD
ncbi:hypothetical protein HGRIS_012054 [Hohenbuehelia grisea]|uniref:Uncharacterized protein n=1 Tax=Hohenbuehelia grisea TaxID=104357 RepID=A0ABR3IR52_9AGAR